MCFGEGSIGDRQGGPISRPNEFNGLEGDDDADGGHFSISIHTHRKEVGTYSLPPGPRRIASRICPDLISDRHNANWSMAKTLTLEQRSHEYTRCC
jgi:hypothetical protein